jgi:hypothetical protein
VGDFGCYLRHLFIGPARKRVARRTRGRGWILFEGVVVDGVDPVVLRRRTEGRVGWEGATDTRHSDGNLPSDLLIEAYQLGSALADIAG